MSNNVIVDVNRLNQALARLDKLFSAASKGTVYIDGVGAGPGAFHTLLNVNNANDVKMEATIINIAANPKYTGGSSYNKNYKFKTNFAHMPVVTATYDGPDDVFVRVNAVGGKGVDSVDVYLKQNGKGTNFKSEFNIHIIAIGN
jgi:hypothetical protein